MAEYKRLQKDVSTKLGEPAIYHMDVQRIIRKLGSEKSLETVAKDLTKMDGRIDLDSLGIDPSNYRFRQAPYNGSRPSIRIFLARIAWNYITGLQNEGKITIPENIKSLEDAKKDGLHVDFKDDSSRLKRFKE